MGVPPSGSLPGPTERTVGALWDAIGCFIDLFTPTGCANDFESCGYDAD